MVSRRTRWAQGLTILAAVSVVVGLRTAQDDSPEAVLKAQNLKRVGSTYILAVESDVQKKINELRLLASQLGAAVRRQENSELENEDQQAMLRELLQQRIALNQTIATLEQEINNYGVPAPGNSYAISERNQLVSQRNQVVTTYNGLVDQIKLLQSEPGADPKARTQLAAEAARRRESFLQSVLDVRQLVDSATKTYAEIEANPGIKAALGTLGRSSKTKLKLGPSPQFLANVKLLDRIEKSVITDSVDLHKEGGVFWVNVTFNGKVTKPMVFDTGAGLTTIPASLAAEIGLNPSPSDPVVRCETADGTVVEAKQKTIPSLRVGRFTVNNVVCAVMPAGKGNVAPLLGQSFHRHFTHKFTPESGHLILSKLETPDQPQAKAARPSKGSTKAKRTVKSRTATSGKTAAGAQPDADNPF